MEKEEIALELTKTAMQNGLFSFSSGVVSSKEQFYRDTAKCVAEAYAVILESLRSEISG